MCSSGGPGGASPREHDHQQSLHQPLGDQGFWARAPLSIPRTPSVLLPDVPFFPSLGLCPHLPPASLFPLSPPLPLPPLPPLLGSEQEVMKMSCVPRRL